ncbi:MAG: FAD-dependent pyridine nucleotide-disulfide oxidoreductase, partial [Phenylobacterium sp.]|nr:FAD-dependent pyridine nucleotide-disulfide oxidoreductase [Phenylobacterium sp.]
MNALSISPGGPTVAVIGAGFSGLLTALHLLRAEPRITVRLVERAPRFGRGRAYATGHPDHLLNVRASNMSAFAERPDHFLQWLHDSGEGGVDGFVRRGRYGDYLQHLLREAVARAGQAGRLLLEQDEAVAVTRDGEGFTVRLALGRAFQAQAVVLALGLMPAPPPRDVGAEAAGAPGYVADPWAAELSELPPGEVLLLGSGLTMVDMALSLAEQDRRVTALSRRGLLPRIHVSVGAAPAPPGLPASPA